MFLRKRLSAAARTAWVLAVMLCTLAAVLALAELAGGGATQQGLVIARQSVRRAAVQCYALEGSYPPSYAYLKENGYGVFVDDSLYFVDYQFLAGNLMPDITVLPRSVGNMPEVSE